MSKTKRGEVTEKIEKHKVSKKRWFRVCFFVFRPVEMLLAEIEIKMIKARSSRGGSVVNESD